MQASDRALDVSNARQTIADAFAADPDFRESYKANIAMLLHDHYFVRDYGLRNDAADDVIRLIIEDKPIHGPIESGQRPRSKKPVICLDFDGVLHAYDSGWKGANVIPDDPVPGAMEFIMRAREHFEVHVFSSRSHQPGGVEAMQGWLMVNLLAASREGGGPVDFGNETVAQVIDSIVFATEKPPALVSIDDRAITFDGTWPAVADLLAFKPWNKRGPA